MGKDAHLPRSRRSGRREQLKWVIVTAKSRDRTTMPNLRRRIEALEKSRSEQREALRTISEKALHWLLPHDVECLISAYGASRVGRPITECELAATRAYAEALERQCRWAGLPSTLESSGLPLDLYHAFVSAFRLCKEETELCLSGLSAAQQGGVPNESESAAIQALNSEMERVSRLAGFGSLAECEAFCPNGTARSVLIPRWLLSSDAR